MEKTSWLTVGKWVILLCIRFINPEVDSTTGLYNDTCKEKSESRVELFSARTEYQSGHKEKKKQSVLFCLSEPWTCTIDYCWAISHTELLVACGCWRSSDPTEVCKGILLNARVSFQFIKHTIVMCSIERKLVDFMYRTLDTILLERQRHHGFLPTTHETSFPILSISH